MGETPPPYKQSLFAATIRKAAAGHSELWLRVPCSFSCGRYGNGHGTLVPVVLLCLAAALAAPGGLVQSGARLHRHPSRAPGGVGFLRSTSSGGLEVEGRGLPLVCVHHVPTRGHGGAGLLPQGQREPWASTRVKYKLWAQFVNLRFDESDYLPQLLKIILFTPLNHRSSLSPRVRTRSKEPVLAAGRSPSKAAAGCGGCHQHSLVASAGQGGSSGSARSSPASVGNRRRATSGPFGTASAEVGWGGRMAYTSLSPAMRPLRPAQIFCT